MMGPNDASALVDEDHVLCPKCDGAGEIEYPAMDNSMNIESWVTRICGECEGTGKIHAPDPIEYWKDADLV